MTTRVDVRNSANGAGGVAEPATLVADSFVARAESPRPGAAVTSGPVDQPASATAETDLDVSVIVCAYSDRRWDDLVAAVESLRAQATPALEVIVVCDHNPNLYKRAVERWSDVVVVENSGASGLSGARNSGVAVATGQVIAFLDDDAVADPDWLRSLLSRYSDPVVIAAGGSIEPLWLGDRPRWFPDEFLWVVGCSYRGLPEVAQPVRNLIGCNMSFRRDVFESGLTFRGEVGRVGLRPTGCEETEFCIRASRQRPGSVVLFEPGARVGHRVPPERGTWRYFAARCYGEGLSKAVVSRLVGAQSGLASERAYTFGALPRGVARAIAEAVTRRDPSQLGRAAAIVAGLAITAVGYSVGLINDRLSKARRLSLGAAAPERQTS